LRHLTVTAAANK